MKNPAIILLFVAALTLFMPRQILLAQDDRRPPPVILTDEQAEYPLGAHLEYLADPTGQLTIAEVSAPEYDARFTPADTTSLGMTSAVGWLRFRANNQATFSTPWVLEIAYPFHTWVTLYLPKPNAAGFTAKTTGNRAPFSSRDIPDTNFVFELPLPPQTEQTVYVRIQSEPMIFSLKIWSLKAFTAATQTEYLWLGLFFGSLLIMLVYNLFIFVSLRERSYLYYVFFLVALIFSQAGVTGLGNQYLWPETIWFRYLVLMLPSALLFVFLLKFTMAFLVTHKRVPRLHFVLNLNMILIGGFTVLVVIIGSPPLIFAVLLLLGISGAILMFLSGIVTWRQGYRPARYYLLAWSALLGALIMMGLWLFGVISIGGLETFSNTILQIGAILAVALVSFGLSDRISLLRNEAEQANLQLYEYQDQLENIVNTRTVELKQAVKQLHQEIVERQQTEEKLRQLSQAIEQSPSTVVIADLQGQIEYVNPKFTQITGYTLSEVLGKNPRLLKSGQHAPEYYQELWETILSGREWRGEFINRKKNGELYWELVSITPIRNAAGETTHFLKVAEDITERVKINQAMQKAYNELATLSALSTNMTSTLELTPLLKLILERLHNVVDFSSATVITLDGDEGEFLIHAGPRQRIDRTGLRFNLANFPPLADAVARYESLYIPDALTQPNFIQAIEHLVSRPNPIDLAYLRTWLVVPLVIRKKVIGLLVLVHEEPNSYDEPVREFVQTFANQVALAMENAHLYQQAQDTAITQERQRLARELHDSVTQTLYSINLFANATKLALAANKPVVAQEHIQELSSLITEAMLDMRLLIFELRPPVLEEAGLVTALQTRLEAVETRAGIEVQFEVKGQNNLPLTIQAELYRIAQEALTNVSKHARASQVEVRLQFCEQYASLEVQDNGVGFNLKNAPQSGKLGLRSIAERVEKINGALTIDSILNQGTLIRVDIDLTERN